VGGWVARVVRFSVVAATAVAAGAVVAAPAEAAVPGLQYVVGHTGFDSTVYKSVTVSCPAGLSVVGLGFELAGAVGSVVLDDFIPNATSVTVGAGEVVGPGEPSDGTTASWSVGATAVCAVALPGLRIVSQTSAFTTGGRRAITATCPGGTQLVGAGSSLSNGWGQISVQSLDLTSTGATASAIQDEDGYSGSWSVTAYAICANPLPGLHIVLATNQFGGTPQRVATATCPSGQRVTGGGWNIGGLEQVLAVDMFVADGTGTTVTGSVDADGYTGSWNTAAFAICADA
jgi:hypothetical protein